MKPFITFIILLSTFTLQAQIRMQVEGDFQLFGRMNINSQGINNVFVGQAAGVATTTGEQNVFMGIRAGFRNTSGGANTYMGHEAGRNNFSGDQNTAYGQFALSNNQVSGKNIAIGSRALLSLEDGWGEDPVAGDQDLGTTYNLAIGTNAGQLTNDFSRFGAERNTFVGNNSAGQNTTGFRNAFFGFQTGDNNVTGSFNTLVGYGAEVSGSSFTNAGAFGSDAQVNASNKIRIGDDFVTTVESNNWSVPSDKRFKTNIQENVPGLEFVMTLRPVTYQFDVHKYNAHIRPEEYGNRSDDPKQSIKEEGYQQAPAVVQTGLIAQEVEVAAERQGFDFNGVKKPTNPKDNYGISYSILVVPVIKALQEQQAQIENLKTENLSLKAANNNLEERIARLEAIIEQLDQKGFSSLSPSQKVELSDATLYQNRPNPFSENTIISYYIPETTKQATLEILSTNGRLLKSIRIGSQLEGTIQIKAGTLAAGTYLYRLRLDGQVIDAKQMVLTK